MKKILFFALLLTAGLLLLYWFDKSRGSTPPRPPELLPQPPGGAEQGLTLGGSSRGTLFRDERALLTVESEDSRTEGDVDLLTGVHLKVFDPEHETAGAEEAVRCTISAERATWRRLGSVDPLRPNWEARVALEVVEAQILEGVPLAPLSFQAPTAEVDLREGRQRVSTDEDFSARSPELDIVGRGLYCELDRSLIEIRQHGRVELRRAGATPAVFSVTGDGPLQVRREADDSVVLEGWQGALLELGGAQPGRLTAEHVALRARRGPSGELSIERLDAEGAVDWTSDQAHFQSETATASFTPEGRLEHAHLAGLPRAQLALQLAPEVLPGAAPAAAGAEDAVLVSGQDALDITWREERFDLAIQGLSTVETRDFRLRSATGVGGWLAQDRRSAHFESSGGVEVESGIATLETAAFELDIEEGEVVPGSGRGPARLRGRASGGARLAGTLPHDPGQPERGFTLTSPDGLTIERSPEGWRVLDSTNVEVSLTGKDGFRGRADRVHDLELFQRSGAGGVSNFRFQAEGNVSFVTDAGQFGGEGLELYSVEPVPAFRLTGTPEKKAFLVGEDLNASALSVEVAGESLHATGQVTFDLERVGPQGGRLQLETEDVRLEHTASPELIPGERLHDVRLTAQDGVRVTVVAADGSSVVGKSERLSGQWRERRVQDAPSERLGFLFVAEGAVHADVLDKDSELTLESERLEIDRTSGDEQKGFHQLLASGDVRFRSRGTFDFGGEGELLVLDADRHASLQAAPHGRVRFFGPLLAGQASRLTAERVDFDAVERGAERLRAQQPELRLGGIRARGANLVCERDRIELSGGVRASGSTSANVPWTMDADQFVLVGRPLPEGEASGERPTPRDPFDAIEALGSVDFRLGDGVRAQGTKLSVRRTTGVLRLEGAPAVFSTPYARLETTWVEFDHVLQVLVATGAGRMYSQAGAPGTGWTLDFLSASTLLELDSLVFVVQEPVLHAFDSTMRSSWAVFWLDREAMQRMGSDSELVGGLQRAFEQLKSERGAQRMLRVLDVFRSPELSRVLREAYFEGPVEMLNGEELLARADAIYLDPVSQHGWLARATVNLSGAFLQRENEDLVVKADWLRLSSDASLRADRATVTSCTFDDPHVRVVTGDLRIVPLMSGGKRHFRLLLKDNRVEMYNWLRIPLPTIDVNTDDEFNLLWPTLSVADSARFGTFLGLTIERPADWVGEQFDSAVRGGDEEPPDEAQPGMPPEKRVDAHYKIDGSYLGSRGGLLDLGLEIDGESRVEEKKDYWFDLYLGVVYDSGDDRGFIRVPADDRDTLRTWLRSQSYFQDKKNTLSFSVSDQSDAGVQSEFFEGQFLRYERSETYGQWRRSSEENFVQASAKVRLDTFRSDVEELPSLTGYRGRSPLFSLGKLSVLHTGDARAEYLRRREGGEFGTDRDDDGVPDPLPNPFGLPAFFPDGLGDREELRLDTNQALEAPVVLGSGWKLTPFVSARGTYWSQGVDEADSPTRVIAEGGARLASLYWKRSPSGKLYQFAPFIELKSELGRSDNDGTPVQYDSLDQQLTGDMVTLGARSRLGVVEGDSLLDLEVLGTHANDRSDGGPDAWLPVQVFGRLQLSPFGHEFEVYHDGRYDVENSETTYSLISLATRFGNDWGFQAGHQRGRSATHEALFEAATVSALYRWTEKWEFEAREAFSLLEDQELDTKFVVRRYGHDIVFELESSVREGEGSSVGLSIKPRFGYDPPHVGYVPW